MLNAEAERYSNFSLNELYEMATPSGIECFKLLLFMSRTIDAENIFSRNEDSSEIPTSSIKFLSTKYKIAQTLTTLSDSELLQLSINKLVQVQLQIQSLKQFFSQLKVYSLKTHTLKEIITRDEKIAQYKLKQQLTKDLTGEKTREYYFKQIQLDELEAMDLYRQSTQELEILQYKEQLQKLPKESNLEDRINDLRIDYIPKKPTSLLDKNGKVLQSFIITDKRKELQDGVFRQTNLPTMSIEEYMEREIANGNVNVKPANHSNLNALSDDSDEDDDEALYKKRDFDDFKDANPRGWGNRHNKG